MYLKRVHLYIGICIELQPKAVLLVHLIIAKTLIKAGDIYHLILCYITMMSALVLQQRIGNVLPHDIWFLCTYDIEWPNKFISALDKIIACCLKTPKHCLARSWIIIIARSYAKVIPCLCLHFGILKLHIQKNTVPWPFEGAIHLSLLYSLTKAHQCGKWIDIEIAHRLALGAGVAWATTAPGAKPWPISILPR